MYNLLNIANILISLAIVVGSIAAFKMSFRRTVSEVQERVISALQVELDEIRQQLSDVKTENIRLNHTLTTIIAALAKIGIYITIAGDVINIENANDGKVHVTRIVENGDS